MWRLQGGTDAVWARMTQGAREGQEAHPTGAIREALLRGVPTALASACLRMREFGAEKRSQEDGEHRAAGYPSGTTAKPKEKRVIVAGKSCWHAASPNSGQVGGQTIALVEFQDTGKAG